FPRFFQAKIKIPTDPEKARSIMKAVERQAAGRVEKVDGVKVWTDDKTWVLVRASGTEPIIRIFGESDTEEKVNSVLKKFSKIVKSAQAS
ncbi:MAG: phosphoglucosamine mutase, partial [Thaumarchaeota archaeon]|nr:phosphoglucosamine mutase [Nitrososphaerota archaeon]